MALPSVDVNYLAVVVVTVVSFLIGMIWYMFLFGKVWQKEMGFSDKDMKKAKEKGMALPMILNLIGTLAMVFVSALFVGWLNLSGFSEGATLGFWIWLGFFAATTLLGDVLWEMKSWKLFFINALYWLVNLVVVAGILAVWK